MWLVALFDAVRHRQTKRRGYQLQRGIVICLFAYVLQDVLLLSYSSLSRGSNSRKAEDVLIAFKVFRDLADSIFMVSHPLLLQPVVSATFFTRPSNITTGAGPSAAYSCRLLVSVSQVWKCSYLKAERINRLFPFKEQTDQAVLKLVFMLMYSITRDNLGPYKSKVLVTPAVYFLTKTVRLTRLQGQTKLGIYQRQT